MPYVDARRNETAGSHRLCTDGNFQIEAMMTATRKITSDRRELSSVPVSLSVLGVLRYVPI